MKAITSMISGIAILSLSACATGPSAYGPATHENGYGFSVSKIENDRFRIHYTAKNDVRAKDYALLRAAETTLEEGYSHFRVLGGDTVTDMPRRSSVSTSVGFGTGRGYYGRGSSVGVGVNINDVARALNGPKISHLIEIRLLNTGSDEPAVFHAQSVKDNIKPEAYKGEGR